MRINKIVMFYNNVIIQMQILKKKVIAQKTKKYCVLEAWVST